MDGSDGEGKEVRNPRVAHSCHVHISTVKALRHDMSATQLPQAVQVELMIIVAYISSSRLNFHSDHHSNHKIQVIAWKSKVSPIYTKTLTETDRLTAFAIVQICH